MKKSAARAFCSFKGTMITQGFFSFAIYASCLLIWAFSIQGCAIDKAAGKETFKGLLRNDLVLLLEQNNWKFVSTPTADIVPGAIIAVEGDSYKVIGTLKDCFSDETTNALAPKGPFPAALPELSRQYAFDAEGTLAFADFFTAGPEFNTFGKFVLKINDASKHSLSIIALNQQTKDHWSKIKDSECGGQLRKLSTHVVTSVLKATDFSMTFLNAMGSAVHVSKFNVGNYLSLKGGVEISESENGGLNFKKAEPLPFAFQSEPVKVPELRGKLEIAEKKAHIPKGQHMNYLNLRNVGEKELSWRVKKHPDRGFTIAPERGHLGMEESDRLIVRRMPYCVDTNSSDTFILKVTETDQTESRKITVDDSCPPTIPYYREAALDEEAITKLIEGEARYREGNYHAALVALKKAEELNSDVANSPAFKNVAGLASYKSGDHERALIYFRSLAAEKKEGHVYAAFTLAAKQDFPNAERELQKGKAVFENDHWVRAQVFNAFSKPLTDCVIPPAPKAIFYQDEITASLARINSLKGNQFRDVFLEESKRLSKIDGELPKLFAGLALCEKGKTATVKQTDQVAGIVNSIVQRVSADKTFDARSEPFFEATERAIAKNEALRSDIVKTLEDYVSFMSARLKIPLPNLRANVFMLDRKGLLRIPAGLYFNMYDPEEISINIPVGFGSTGISFERRGLTVTEFADGTVQKVSLVWSGRTTEIDKNSWETRQIFLPASEMKKLTQLPAWIISVPVFDAARGLPIAVMNVDCINQISVFDVYERGCNVPTLKDYGQSETETYFWSSKLSTLLEEAVAGKR